MRLIQDPFNLQWSLDSNPISGCGASTSGSWGMSPQLGRPSPFASGAVIQIITHSPTWISALAMMLTICPLSIGSCWRALAWHGQQGTRTFSHIVVWRRRMCIFWQYDIFKSRKGGQGQLNNMGTWLGLKRGHSTPYCTMALSVILQHVKQTLNE